MAKKSEKPDKNEIMDIPNLSDYLDISKSTLYKLAQEKKLPGQKVGRHWRFRKETIDRWLDKSVENEETDKEKGENNS